MKLMTPKTAPKRGFTLVEMLVVIAVIGILVAILLPVISNAKAKAEKAKCAAHMKQIGVAFQLYANDNGGRMVPQSILEKAPENPIGPTGEGTHTYWPDLMRDYIKNRELLVCPSFKVPGGYGIGYNTPEFGVYDIPNFSTAKPAIFSIADPSGSVVFADVAAISNPSEKDPDQWKATPDGKLTMGAAGVGAGVPGNVPGVVLGPEYNVYFRTPSDSTYDAIPHRLINRHGKKANTWFADGRVDLKRASSIGFQFPRNEDGTPNKLWLWDR